MSGNEDRILSWSEDNTLRLWDAASGQQIGPAMRHDGRGLGRAVERRGPHPLLVRRQTLRLWDAATGQPIGPPCATTDRFGARC